MSNYTIQEESFPQCFGAHELFIHHWNEVGVDKDIVLDVDMKTYEALDLMGKYKFYTAQNESKVIGYLGYIISNHLHYASTMFAYEDIFYVSPEARTSFLGLKLMKFAEPKLKELGVKKILHHTKMDHFIGPILKRRGFVPQEIIYKKNLGE